MRIIKNLILCSVFFMMISACCRNIACDCVPRNIHIQYQSINDGCPEQFADSLQLQRFSENTNTLISSSSLSQYGNAHLCDVEIYYETGVYWVISSEIASISDTLKISDPVFADPSDRSCCNCETAIISADIRINEFEFSEPNIIRSF